MISRNRLKTVLEKFTHCELAVLGDVMLDEFLWGKVDRISPEAPVPIVQVKRETWRPGGAANVASNIIALGAKAHILGVVGDDGIGRRLREAMAAEGIKVDGLMTMTGRPTTLKTRIIGQNQQMIRIDREQTEIPDVSTIKAIQKQLKNYGKNLQGIVVSDYAKGVVCKDILEPLIKSFKRDGRFVAVDPKLKNFYLYEGATIITPNAREAEAALGRVFETDDDVLRGGVDLLKQYKTDAILITRGESGMSLFQKKRPPLTIPTRALEVFDVTGAGDTVIATFSLAMAAGCPMPEAVEIANLAAGVVVGIVGTATASPEKVLEHYDRVHFKPEDQ